MRIKMMSGSPFAALHKIENQTVRVFLGLTITVSSACHFSLLFEKVRSLSLKLRRRVKNTTTAPMRLAGAAMKNPFNPQAKPHRVVTVAAAIQSVFNGGRVPYCDRGEEEMR